MGGKGGGDLQEKFEITPWTACHSETVVQNYPV